MVESRSMQWGAEAKLYGGMGRGGGESGPLGVTQWGTEAKLYTAFLKVWAVDRPPAGQLGAQGGKHRTGPLTAAPPKPLQSLRRQGGRRLPPPPPEFVSRPPPRASMPAASSEPALRLSRPRMEFSFCRRSFFFCLRVFVISRAPGFINRRWGLTEKWFPDELQSFRDFHGELPGLPESIFRSREVPGRNNIDNKQLSTLSNIMSKIECLSSYY